MAGPEAALGAGPVLRRGQGGRRGQGCERGRSGAAPWLQRWLWGCSWGSWGTRGARPKLRHSRDRGRLRWLQRWGWGCSGGSWGSWGTQGVRPKFSTPSAFLRGSQGVPGGSPRAPGRSQRGSRGILRDSLEFPRPLPLPALLGPFRFRVPTCETGICPATGDVTDRSGCHWRAGNSDANGGAGGGFGGGASVEEGPGLWAGPQRSSAMAAALALGLLLGLLGNPGAAAKVLHSLRYLFVAVSEPSPGIPQYMIVGYLDGIPFVRYDSERGRVEPLTQWIKDGVKPEYWERETQISVRYQHIDARNLETLRERYNQSGGLHTRLRVYGCDLLSDGSIRGSHQNGYDGRDFISFDLGSGRWVAADSAAEITRRRWEEDGTVAEARTNYLKNICPEWLRKYVGYGQKELERKVPPDVHVSGREEHRMLILSCHAYGFYPNTIAVSWMKGGETLDQETEWGGIVPNSDGTFHTWARIEALPEEREQYRCRVEHPGMPEPGIFAWEPTSGGNLTVVVAVSVIAAILILIFIGFIVWKLQSGNTRDGGREGTRIHPAPFWESCDTDADSTLFPQGGGTGMDTTQQPVSSNGGSSSGSPLCGSQDGSWG
ncbi:class I histocompatibility antigen, F10 alpha chain-like isoform X7 [Agelaius tricolor]|uniref:class I histocompatibility antigen, F10 alpha chain-like isoform X7 n=1 Tax=Agelaius tricolor TaxID=9191 RepID=UPI0039F1756B